jgi:gluconolactonase
MNVVPQGVATEVFAEFPRELGKRQKSEWGRFNRHDEALDCFLEGPSFDRAGNLYVTDIPFGRILRISREGKWTVIAEYDGWPNGLKVHRDGGIFVADHRCGILRIDSVGTVEKLVDNYRSEHLKGPNDLVFATNGDLYFTDQGQTGMQDASGRVFRLTASGRLDLVIDRVPSPNGIVLNAEETQVYVAVTRANAIWRMPMMPDGGVSKVGTWIQLSGALSGPDGLALDQEGGVLVAHPGMSVLRFDRFGRLTHYLEPGCDLFCTNIAFDPMDPAWLYVVDSGNSRILRAKMLVPGNRPFSHL